MSKHRKNWNQQERMSIILCKQKSDILVEITLSETNDQIFASRYQTILPDKQTFINLLNDDSVQR